MAAETAQLVTPDVYGQLVARIRQAADRWIDPGGRVAVISRGDDELLRLGGRSACHFPQDSTGQYAGYHPATGADAVAHLEELRASGVDYLLIPRTAFWWLDHYTELERHLASSWRQLNGDHGACRIYAVPGRRVQSRSTGQAAHDTLRPTLAFLDAVLPPDAALAVMGDTADVLARLRPGAIALAAAGLGTLSGPAPVADLPTVADYLFVPTEGEEPGEIREIQERLAQRFRRLAERERLGVLFDLRFLNAATS